MPISRHVRMTRTAISPRLAMRIFSSTLGLSSAGRALTIARAVWCLPCGPGNGRSAGSPRSTRPTSYLRDQARQGAPEGLVAVADHQTAGRGRLDRRWESPPGANLLASVLLRPGCDPDDLHLCTGAVALAAADACAGGGRRRAGAQVAQRPAGGRGEAGRRPGRGRVRRRPRWRPWWSGSAINVAWPGPAGRRGHLPGRPRRDGAAGRPERPARAPAGRTGRPAPPARRRGGRRGLADEVRRPLRHAGPAGPGHAAGRASCRDGRRPSTTPATWSSRRPRAHGR